MDYSDVILQTNYPNLDLLRRGKVRDIYTIPGKDELLIAASDRISAFDVVMPNGIPGKGEALNSLSVYWFERTKDIFPNHYIECVDNRAMRVLKAERIDIEWIIRAYLYGSAWRAYKKGRRTISGVTLPNGLQLAEKLPEPILTPTTKAETGHDIEITKQQAVEKGLVTVEEWESLEEITHRLFDYYREEAASKHIIIPDFKLEFGRVKQGLIQIDEPPTHDSSRFWSERNYEIGQRQEGHALDKEFLRQYLIKVGFMGEGEPPVLPKLVVEQISKRCIGVYEVLTGKTSIDNLRLKTVDEVIQEINMGMIK